jgi:anaphase-promoting complex subunit 3
VTIAAVRLDRQAIQVDPRCTYAYTLCGHELVASKDPEQAASYFRQTIQCDDRHYNAWYVSRAAVLGRGELRCRR